jgi:hypothetical protein
MSMFETMLICGRCKSNYDRVRCEQAPFGGSADFWLIA